MTDGHSRSGSIASVTGDLIAAGKLSIGDGYRAKNSELSPVGVPFARAGNIDNGFHFEDADRFPEEDLARVGGKISRPGDVVFTSKGTVGRMAYVRDSTLPFVYAPQLCYWRALDSSMIDNRWLYYWMFGREFGQQMSGAKGQTDMADYVSLTDQRRMEITLPPINLQRAISGVLGALDDKIEQNRRTAQTLERLAREIFRAWFVDFEPVKAKAAGATAFPSMPQPVFDVLPARFVDSDIGLVPEGWEVVTFGDVLVLAYGKALKASQRKPGPIPVYGSNGRVGWHDEALVAGPGIVVGRKGNPGTVEWAANEFFPIDTTFFVQLKCDRCSLQLLYYQLLTADLERLATDSAVPGINRNMVYAEQCLVPDKRALEVFDDLTMTLSDMQTALEKESRKLVKMRDYLLPKLLSGAVRVRDAERIAEEVNV